MKAHFPGQVSYYFLVVVQFHTKKSIGHCLNDSTFCLDSVFTHLYNSSTQSTLLFKHFMWNLSTAIKLKTHLVLICKDAAGGLFDGESVLEMSADGRVLNHYRPIVLEHFSFRRAESKHRLDGKSHTGFELKSLTRSSVIG